MLVSSRDYVRNRPEFTLGNVELEIVRDYQNLGLIFNYNGKFEKLNSYYMRKVVGQCFLYYVKLVLYFFQSMFFLSFFVI